VLIFSAFHLGILVAKKKSMESSNISTIALIVAIIAGIFGIFGGIPGIKTLFFNYPSILIKGFMPVVVFDEGNNLKVKYPKFSLNGLSRVENLNNYDITINEIRVYGRTKDSSGKYKFPGDKPIFYELNLLGFSERGDEIIKSNNSAFIRFKIAHFNNEQGPGLMRGPMTAGRDQDLGQPIFHIFFPSFSQLFIWNEMRAPHQLVDEVKRGKLIFSINFNNELCRILPNKIFNLYHCSISEWTDKETLIKMYNANEITK
jgi:hypothetical protein